MEKELDTEIVADTQNDITQDKEQVSPESAEIAALRAEMDVLQDKYLRVVAESENVKRRAALDAESVARVRAMLVAENFIPLVDAIDAALVLDKDNEGLQTLSRAAAGALVKNGISRIETTGQVLNPMFHHAVTIAEEPKDIASGIIVSEMQPGYMFGDTVLRPAMVVVKK